MADINGNLIGLRMDGNYFHCETACSFSYEHELLPASSIQSGYYEESIPGRTNWSVTLNGNLSLPLDELNTFFEILDKVKSRERVYLEIMTRVGINPYFKIYGWAWPQTGQLDAQVSQASTFTNSFKGDGEFFVDREGFNQLIINSMPANADKPLTWDASNW